MSAIINGVQFRCDWCGIYSEERILAASGIIVETSLPDDWTSVGYGSVGIEPTRSIQLQDAFGNRISNLCPACSARPVGDLLTHLGQLAKPADVTA